MTHVVERAAMGVTAPLRVGVAVHDNRVPRWVAEIILALSAMEAVDLYRLRAREVPPGVRGVGQSREWSEVAAGRVSVSAGLRWFYRRLDGRLFGRPGDPTVHARVGGLLGRIPWAVPGDLDVVLDLAVANPVDDQRTGGTEAGAATGPVALRLRQESVGDASPLGGVAAFSDLADVLARTELMATAVVASVAGGAERVVGRVVSSNDLLSARRGGRNHWPKVGRAIVDVVAAFAREGQPATVDDAGLPPVAPRPVPSTAVSTGLALARIASGYFARLLERTLAPERWIVAVHVAEPGVADEATRITPDPHRTPYLVLEPPPGLEWADPFVVETDDGMLLFVEEWVRSVGRGRLVVLELDGGRPSGPPRPVLDLGHHHSYPFVFRWQGEWYLMPEQASTGKLDLYRATDFPTAWTWDRTVLPHAAADATIERIDGRWWLFASLAGLPGTTPDELHLYHGPTPLGPWQPHRANPVVMDVRRARPAGRLFCSDGAWYRPAQNGGPSYGHSVMLLRLEQLDESSYRERLVGEIGPGWAPGVSATHTLNRAGLVTAIDARRREPRWPLLRRRATPPA